MKRGIKFELVQILAEIKRGLTPSQISKKYDIPKSTLQYSVDKLKKLGCIEKRSYGVWEYVKEVRIVPKGRVKKYEHFKQIRGHAFIWKVRFIQENINWEDRLIKHKIPYQLIFNKRIARIIFNGRKIWLGRKGLTIYEPLDFLGSSAIQTKGKAVWELDQLIKNLGRVLNLNLNFYKFTTSREHYGIIKNELAKQYNEKGEKLYVRGDDGSVWLWIDNSHSLHELENKDPNLNRKIQEWYNDHKKHNFEVTPTFVMTAINQNTQNLEAYAKHLKAHVGSIKVLGTSVNRLTKIITELKEGGKK